MKGYKVFNSDWTYKDFQFEVGKTYQLKGKLELCKNGFHFYKNLVDSFKYHSFNNRSKVAIIEANGDIIEDIYDKIYATNNITIIQEISWEEVLYLVNAGNNNTGYYNTGDYNTGCNNTGCCNTGNGNTGSNNTGCYNTGNGNTGRYNTGNGNTGCCNTGDYNTGNYNTGCNNTGCCNTGFFNTKTSVIYSFNKPTNLSFDEYKKLDGFRVIEKNFILCEWVNIDNMTDEEKNLHIDYQLLNGYLKTYTYNEAWKNMWNKISNEDKQKIFDLPNFNTNIFGEITGIKI